MVNLEEILKGMKTEHRHMEYNWRDTAFTLSPSVQKLTI